MNIDDQPTFSFRENLAKALASAASGKIRLYTSNSLDDSHVILEPVLLGDNFIEFHNSAGSKLVFPFDNIFRVQTAR